MRRLRIVLLAASVLLLPLSAQATYSQQYTLSQDSTFQQQIMVAMLQTAIAVASEAVTTQGHVTRAAFAVQVLQNPTKWQPIVAIIIASQNNNALTPLTTPSTVADSLIQTAMNAQWSNMAGYFQQ